MAVFKCTECDYQTQRKNNLDRHININHNINTINQTQFTCSYCNISFTKLCYLSRHKNKCMDKNKVIYEYEQKIDELNKLLIAKDDMINSLKSEVTHLKLIVDNAGSMIKSSMSTMTYVIKTFKDAPALEAVKDYSLMHDDQGSTEFVETLISEYNHKTLHIYLGDFIIKTHKKEDPSKQSIWNSDTSRLTYIIREIISHNKTDWTIDKKGIKIVKYIITPMLEYIDPLIRIYIESFSTNYKKCSMKEIHIKTSKLRAATEILQLIEDRILSDDIIKYITPHFYLNKSDSFEIGNIGDVDNMSNVK